VSKAGQRDRHPWTPGAVLALGGASVLWAAAGIAAKIALGYADKDQRGYVPPITLAALRFGLGGGLLYVALRSRGHWFSVERADRSRFTILGTLGVTISYSIFYASMRFTSATDTTLIVAAEPILIVLLAWRFLGETLSIGQAFGMVMGLLGVYLIVCQGAAPRLESTALANGMIVLALISEATSSIVGKSLTRTYPGLVVACRGMLIGAAVLTPLSVVEIMWIRPSLPGPEALLAIVYLAVICSCLCYAIWYSLMERYPVSSMAGFLLIQPVLAPVYGYLFLRESLTVWSLVGALLTVVGICTISTIRSSAAVHDLSHAP